MKELRVLEHNAEFGDQGLSISQWGAMEDVRQRERAQFWESRKGNGDLTTEGPPWEGAQGGAPPCL